MEVFRQIAQKAQPPRKFGGVGNIASPSSNILALFSGSSGTGKTMAAEVIARELRTRVYRVKPRDVVGRYIGETEKNLTRIFGAAQKTGAVLLFDEADALFGKRSKVKDSHDRYANVEVSSLLAKIESYRGVIILTSNHKANIDPRVACRMKYLIEFSPPIPSPQVLPRR
jgi:SpoVK/Ycf46/Vps4 family AAA+-type ATPase